MKVNIEKKIEDIKELIVNKKPKILGNHKFFSVMILLVNIEDKLHLLYEMRSAKLQSQPNEVSFPGGRIEAFESSKEAAFRETFEEIGIEKDKIKYLGEGDRVITVSDFTIYSHIGYIDEKTYEQIKINEEEVSEVFLVPLNFFVDKEPQIHKFDILQHSKGEFPYELVKISPEYKFYSSKVEVPIYPYEENKVIWGLTGRLTRAFVNLLKENKLV